MTDQPGEARTAAENSLAIYGMQPSYRAMLDREGYAEAADAAIIGDEATVAARFEELAALGVDELCAHILTPTPEDERAPAPSSPPSPAPRCDLERTRRRAGGRSVGSGHLTGETRGEGRLADPRVEGRGAGGHDRPPAVRLERPADAPSHLRDLPSSRQRRPAASRSSRSPR